MTNIRNILDVYSKAYKEQAIYESFEGELSSHLRALDSGRIGHETLFRTLITRDPDLELFSVNLIDSPLPETDFEEPGSYICDAGRGNVERIKHHPSRLDGHRVYLVGSKNESQHYELDLKVVGEIRPAPIFDASTGRFID